MHMPLSLVAAAKVMADTDETDNDDDANVSVDNDEMIVSLFFIFQPSDAAPSRIEISSMRACFSVLLDVARRAIENSVHGGAP